MRHSTEYKKNQRQQKKFEKMDRKNQNTALLAEEEKNLGVKDSTQKVTQYDIRRREEERVDQERLNRKEEERLNEIPLENVNHILPDEEGARTIDEAIEHLRVGNKPSTQKQITFKSFEKQLLPRLREENPNLKMSQIKELAWKAWQKAPENPLNQ